MKVELVVFDMAGTTVDEDNVVYKTVQSTLTEAGYQVSQEQVLAAGAGKEKSQAIHDVLTLVGPAPSDETVQALFANFQKNLARAYQELDVREQPGAAACFATLRAAGVKVVLNTGYNRATAEGLLAKLDWQIGRDLDDLVTASDVARGRPHGDMIELAMSRQGLSDPAKVAKIGDSAIDIEEGHRAHCGFTFGITTGAQTREQLTAARPTAIVASLAEMTALLA
ncbi:phosphonatase-like hydrolase [Roseibacillus ishigakijimensis]|uniref:Phosphonatase-like hydrolase n=1 Tax=Roseibacillus ishigakijimensis TaxID=454146 RepID=A0A934VNV8_9BACT|nr:phosphonatase-like hydrolase [Roseibacillus ishigakijimensis]MBK1835445.1 phosphonatase-like hydrolase [Roseibacillus ishigakijimensis]